jgi:hypothetical protein
MMKVPRAAFLLALVLVLGACSRSSSSQRTVLPEEQARVDALAEEMLAVARAADKKRSVAPEAAAASLVPRADLGPCPIKVPVVGTEDMTKLGQSEPKDAPVDWRSVRADQMMVATRAELATKKSVRLKHVEEMIAFQRGRLEVEPLADVEKWIRYYGDLKNASWEMVVVAVVRDDPEIKDKESFKAGTILGRAYVYSYVDDAVVCAGTVVAQSSEILHDHKVKTADGKDFGLVFDLENEAFRAAARTMVRAGPRREEDAGAGDASTKADASTKRDAGSKDRSK